MIMTERKKEIKVEKTRYSDDELIEFKNLILDKLELAKKDYDQMMQALMGKDGNSVDDTAPTFKVMEEGYATQSKEELTILAARQQKFIKGLKKKAIVMERSLLNSITTIY